MCSRVEISLLRLTKNRKEEAPIERSPTQSSVESSFAKVFSILLLGCRDACCCGWLSLDGRATAIAMDDDLSTRTSTMATMTTTTRTSTTATATTATIQHLKPKNDQSCGSSDDSTRNTELAASTKQFLAEVAICFLAFDCSILWLFRRCFVEAIDTGVARYFPRIRRESACTIYSSS